jgi:hypothetical protein
MAVSPHQTVAEKIAEAQKVVNEDPEKAEATYKDVLQRDPGSNDAALRNFETALIGLGELYRTQNRVDDLADLIRQSRSALSQFARAKTSKLGTSSSWHSPARLKTEHVQCVNFSTYSPKYPALSKPKSRSQSHASNGPLPNAAASSDKSLKLVL